MRFRIQSFVAPLLLHQHCALAQTNGTADQACEEISAALPDRVSFPLGLSYISETQKYWSTALRDLQPACVVLPQSAEEVSSAIKILNQYPEVNFAAKSGGHDPNPGHGSIQGGVLIAMREITGTTYDNATGLAYVKPGGEWNDVIGALDSQGVAVVGGRLGIVGVGGYLLQGGISFLSAQYGLAADSIVGWKTVMSNGTIVQVDAAEQPDLAVAMRGSGSQFGIVTQFTIQAHPIGQVWGGMRIYSSSSADQIYAALHDFTPSNADNPKEAIIVSNADVTGNGTVVIIFYFYDGPTPPAEGAFANFLAIPSISDSTSTQRYAKLLETNGEGAALLNARVSFRTFTIPYIKSHPEMYQEITAKWKSITAPYIDNILHATSLCSVDFQPFPAIIGAESQKRGGNAMGISGNDGDRLLLELQCSWALGLDDATLYEMSHEITDWLATKVPEWMTDAPEASRYLPLFMNDAMADQNVTGTYKDYAKFKALQEEVDPQGVFRERAGGFKY